MKRNKGVTLIALVVSIIILLILAGIAINLTIGNNGIFSRENEAIEKYKVAEWQEKLEIEKEPIFIKNLGKITIGEYLESIIEDGIIKEDNIQDTDVETVKYITVQDKYVFLLEEEEGVNIKITYEGEADKLKPLLDIDIIDITRNSITVKAIAERMEGGQYSYYIKDVKSKEEYVLKIQKEESEYTFEGLTHNREYQIKIVAKNSIGESPKESKIIRTAEAYTVTYNINKDNVKTELYGKGENTLNPTFTSSISGFTFVGWREDATASPSVLTSKNIEDTDITLYAVFKQTITLSYNANGGSSTPQAQKGDRYYNNGNAQNPTFTLASAIARTNYSFQNWRLNSTSGTRYNAKSSITLASNAIMYGGWKCNLCNGTRN